MNCKEVSNDLQRLVLSPELPGLKELEKEIASLRLVTSNDIATKGWLL